MANDNISAVLAMKGGSGGGGGGAGSNAVHYTEDTGKSDSEKLQARRNIGAAGTENPDFEGGLSIVDTGEDNVYFGIESTENHSMILLEGEASPTVEIAGVATPTRSDAAATKGYVDGNTVTDTSSTSITLALAADNTIYEYGTLSALTVTAIPAAGDFIIRFTSGATATTTNFPASMVFPEAFSAEANTRYEINVSNGYALAVGWPVS